jgi:CubicO group peptidase (beta-lactamase class C family)
MKIFASVGFALAATAVAAAQEPFAFEPAWAQVVASFRDGCVQAGVVGASLAFVEGDHVRGSVVFGQADRAGGRAVDGDTIFHWASITKTFTGIAVLQQRDRGALRLDQPIVELVPELRAVHSPHAPIEAVTVRHLLTHSGGFRAATWPWGGDRDWHPHEPVHWDQLVAMLPYTEVQFVPGTRFAYSNPGIVFLGRALERLRGEDWEVLVDKNVLRPLGMHRSYFDVTPYHLQRHRSHGYEPVAGGEAGAELVDTGPDFDTGVTVSNGGLNAPVSDLVRYLTFLLGAVPEGSDARGVLARASLEEMWQPVLPTRADGGEQIGLTFFVQERGGTRFVTHTGGQRGFVSFVYVHPASNTGAVAAFNTGTAGPVMQRVRTACMESLSLPIARGRAAVR